MSKYILITFFAIATFIFTACEKRKPVACFEISKSLVKAGDTVTFENCSTNYTDVEWTFPNGGSSKVINPKVIIPSEGNYSVTLKVGLSNFELKNSITKTFIILPK